MTRAPMRAVRAWALIDHAGKLETASDTDDVMLLVATKHAAFGQEGRRAPHYVMFPGDRIARVLITEIKPKRRRK